MPIELKKEDYYQYNYHANIVAIYEHWQNGKQFDVNEQKHRQILAIYHHSLHIKDIIDKNMWRRHLKSKDNQEKIASLEKPMSEISEYFKLEGLAALFAQDEVSNFESQFPFYTADINTNKIHEKKSELSENAIQYITLVNAERVFLGVVRNFFSFMLRNSWYFDIVKQLNVFSILLANYLYIFRLNLNLYVMFTVQQSDHFKELSYWEKSYGYLIANQRQILNDIFWNIILFGISIHYYIKSLQVDKFFAQETTGLGINIFFGIALMFDVWNSYQSVIELENDWQTFKNKYPNLEDELKDSFEKLRREKMSLVYFMSGICIVSLFSGILEIGDYIAKNNPSQISTSVIHVLPFVNIALIGVMFLSQLIYLTRDYWDADYQKLSQEEQQVIQQKALNQAIEEFLKIIIIAIVIFVIASQIPLGGIPQMIVLALITVAMIAIVKMIKDYIEKNYLLTPTSDQGEILKAASTQ